MPILTLSVEDTKDSILRPITMGIARDLINLFGLDKRTQIFYPDESGVMYQHNSTLEKESEFASRMQSQNRFWIEVDERPEPESVYPMTTRNREGEPFLFADDDLRIYLQPLHVAYDVTISFKATFQDRASAERWRNHMRGRMSTFQDFNHHLLTYHYLVPRPQVFILNVLHEMREKKHGYGSNFGEWLKEKGTPRFVALSNLKGREDSDRHLAVREKQSRVWGHFNWNIMPEKGSKEGGSENWVISFDYEFRYERPSECTIYYPYMVHSQLIPEELRMTHDRLRNYPEGGNRIFSLMGMLLETTWNNTTKYHIPYDEKTQGVVPQYDDWKPRNMPRKTRRVLQVLVHFNEEDPFELFKIDDDGLEHVFQEDVLAFIKSEHKFIAEPYHSVFNVSLHNQFDMLHPRYIKMDKDGELRTTESMKPRNYYHVRLALVMDWSLLTADAIKRLFKWKLVVRMLLKWMGYDETWIDDNIDDPDKIIDRTANKFIPEQPQVRTVEFVQLVTYRHDKRDPLFYGELLREGLNKDGAHRPENQYTS